MQILRQATARNIEVMSDICNVVGICASANYAKNSFLNCVIINLHINSISDRNIWNNKSNKFLSEQLLLRNGWRNSSIKANDIELIPESDLVRVEPDPI